MASYTWNITGVDTMKSVITSPQSPKAATCIGKWQSSEMQTSATTSPFVTNAQKSGDTETVIYPKHSTENILATMVYPKHTTEEILAQNLNRISVIVKQTHIRKRPLAKCKAPKHSLRRKTLADIADMILRNSCKNIIVMAGAGISTPSGIPDFRTPGSGLYDNMQKYDLPYPEAIFHIDYFTNNPSPFFDLAKELYPGKYKPNFVHYFVRLLHDKGLLLRCYTQNIDGLERLAGIPPEKLVEAHGTFSSASCPLCYTPFPANEAKECIISGDTPHCKICYGVVKPDVVLFGEELPSAFSKVTEDFPKADLLIVMGTSLVIEPFANLVNAVRPSVPRLLLNREPVGPFSTKPLKRTDVAELGDLSEITRKFVRTLNWQNEMEELMKSHTFKCGA